MHNKSNDCPRSTKLRGRHGSGSGLFARGQAVVEFAIISGVAIILLVVGIQFALIGQCALAVTQLSYTAARYASVHPDTVTSVSDMSGYILQVASPTLLNDGVNQGTDGLTVTMPKGSCPTPNSFGQPVEITVTYQLVSKIFLPNPFLGISFPSQVQSTQTAFCEG